MTPLLWIVLLFLALGIIQFTVSWIMRRLDITPADPDSRSGGFRDVLDVLRSKLEERKASQEHDDHHR